MLTTERAELAGKNVNILMLPEFRAAHDRLVAASNLGDEKKRAISGFKVSSKVQRKDGTQIPVEVVLTEVVLTTVSFLPFLL